MKYKYTFYGEIYRLNGFISALILAIVGFFDNDLHILTNPSYILFLNFVLMYGFIFFWIHPDLIADVKGLEIIRMFGLFRIRIQWKNISLHKGKRTITKYSHIGNDQRFSKVIIKNVNFFEKYFVILAFSENYDEFILEMSERM